MRRSKFVELVSAYLDGELTEKETELLRRELEKNPERRILFASYKRMNVAASKARFPIEEIAAAPIVADRQSAFISILSWGVAGAFACASVAVAISFFGRTNHPSDDQLMALDVAKQVVVTSNVKPSAAPVVAQRASTVAVRTPVQTLISSAKLVPDVSKPEAQPEDLLGRTVPATYSFGSAPSVTRPNASICTPVSFVSMSDH
jgi:anti-sigma factor RsiW